MLLKNVKFSFRDILSLSLFAIACSLFFAELSTAEDLSRMQFSPYNAAYEIEGRSIVLEDGISEVSIAPGAASKRRTEIYQKPVCAESTGYGEQRCLLLLTHDLGGSGTFFYAAAAIKRNGIYYGTRGVLLGDRIIPLTIAINIDAMVITYLDRLTYQSMSETPSLFRKVVLGVKNNELIRLTPDGSRQNIYQGVLILDHEQKSFTLCKGEQQLWLHGDSPAYPEIKKLYQQNIDYPKPYTPRFALLGGQVIPPPERGFGADYEAAFLAEDLILLSEDGSCASSEYQYRSSVTPKLKIKFDYQPLNDDGLYGQDDGTRAISYEFCIPDVNQLKNEVKNIDPTISFSLSPGRSSCLKHQVLCIGSTHQANYALILEQLASLPYVHHLHQSFFE